MRFRLCVVGKPRDVVLAAAITEYEARAARYWPIEIREVKAHADVERESELLLRAAGDARRIVCDERGRLYTSREFAAWLQKLRLQARDVAILIAGAAGVSDDARRDADELLALATWTLPHELARLVLAEQLYRAGTILKGEPYHK